MAHSIVLWFIQRLARWRPKQSYQRHDDAVEAKPLSVSPPPIRQTRTLLAFNQRRITCVSLAIEFSSATSWPASSQRPIRCDPSWRVFSSKTSLAVGKVRAFADGALHCLIGSRLGMGGDTLNDIARVWATEHKGWHGLLQPTFAGRDLMAHEG
jgi:hypothetical protein